MGDRDARSMIEAESLDFHGGTELLERPVGDTDLCDNRPGAPNDTMDAFVHICGLGESEFQFVIVANIGLMNARLATQRTNAFGSAFGHVFLRSEKNCNIGAGLCELQSHTLTDSAAAAKNRD